MLDDHCLDGTRHCAATREVSGVIDDTAIVMLTRRSPARAAALAERPPMNPEYFFRVIRLCVIMVQICR
jgi:hypothetical protein